jgi:hypothetical protein
MKYVISLLFILSCIISEAQSKKIYPYSDGKYWGATDDHLTIIVKPQYDESFFFQNNVNNPTAIVKKSQKFGLIDSQGKELIPVQYEQLERQVHPFGTGKIQGKFRILNFETGKPASSFMFDAIKRSCYCPENYFIVKQNGKEGFINTKTGAFINKTMYDEVDFIYDFPQRGLVKLSSKYGVIDLTTGKVIIPLKYTSIDSYYLGNGAHAIKVAEGDQYKYFDATGKEVKGKDENGDVGVEEMVAVEVARDDNDAYKDLYVYNQGNGNWKLAVERRGYSRTEIIETFDINGYESVEKFRQNFADPAKSDLKVKKNSKVGIININGNILLPIEYDDVERHGNLIKVKRGNQYGLVREDLTELKKPVFTGIGDLNYDLGAVLINMPSGQSGYMDVKTGQIFIPGVTE